MTSEAKPQVTISIDIGFVKMAIAALDDNLKVLYSKTDTIQPEKGQKLNMSQSQLIDNIHALVQSIIDKFDVKQWLIEQQIGKFACYQVMALVHASIKWQSDAPIHYINPKSRLRLKFCDFEPNPETKQYNQNKNYSVANCKAWLELTKQKVEGLDRDQSDAILQALVVLLPVTDKPVEKKRMGRPPKAKPTEKTTA